MENTTQYGLMTKEVFEARKNEFIALRKKVDFTKDFRGGLTKDEYFRINQLHACMLGCEQGKKVVKS